MKKFKTVSYCRAKIHDFLLKTTPILLNSESLFKLLAKEIDKYKQFFMHFSYLRRAIMCGKPIR